MDKRSKILKIGITGNTWGFGKYITDYLDIKNIDYIGFSRSNGYNINKKEDRKRIINKIADCSVLINNTSSENGQSNLLIDFINEYKTEKKIICIGTDITKVKTMVPIDILNEYINKISLYYTVKNLQSVYNNVIYLSWGYHKTHKVINYYPELLDSTTIEQAVEEVYKNLF